jgi:predicted Co/Zn/Cd cation transporter (cation efflux family)
VAIGYVLQTVKLAALAVLIGLIVSDWFSTFTGVFVGVLAFYLMLALFVGERGKKPHV